MCRMTLARFRWADIMTHMLEVLGRANSINVQKVMWCAAELDLAVTRHDIGGAFGGTDTAEFSKLNPNRQIPVLRDGDFALYESNAIVRYLCASYGAEWQPGNPKDFGTANPWMDWYLTTMHPPMTTLFWQLVRTAKADRDYAAISEAFATCRTYWAQVDRHLSERAYLLGSDISMADIPLGCSAYRWHGLDIDRPALPGLHAWYKRLCQRSAYRDHVMLPLT